MTTTAVGSATTAVGNTVRLVASNETTSRTVQRAALQPDEQATMGAGHTEQTILNYASENNMTVTAVAASRPICADFAAAICKAGLNQQVRGSICLYIQSLIIRVSDH